MARPEDRLVYSTDQPFTQAKSDAGAPANKGRLAANSSKTSLPNDGVIRVARERRRASVVTIIHGLAAAELKALAGELQRRCGGGGTTKGGVITLQGDHRELVIAYFESQNRRCKKAGG